MTQPGEFAQDVAFLKSHTELVLLERDGAAVAVAPAYQGRVMTSTFDRGAGPSFGWINRPVIERGLLSDDERRGELEEHIYVFGGEERFWLGPEGGQFALFFKPGAAFEFDDWQTPPAIDTDAYRLVEQSPDAATFAHECELVNHSGARFKVGVRRTVRLLGGDDAAELLGEEPDAGLRIVGYETDNQITNQGDQAWSPDTGLISIWLLGMYKPSPQTVVVIPFEQGPESELGPPVNDDYFGAVPPEHLTVDGGAIFFKGDGTRRGKIGVSPRRSKGIAGSYDAGGRVLNLVTYNRQPAPHGFVNSAWELQDKPYGGDVINAYNDGPPEPGADPLGPFYELETSSPAAANAPGETLRHVQQTWHIHGDEQRLDPIARKLLGVGLEEIKSKL